MQNNWFYINSIKHLKRLIYKDVNATDDLKERITTGW